MLALWKYHKHYLTNILRNDEGQTVLEYAVMIILMGVAIFVAFPDLPDAILEIFDGTSSVLTDSMSPLEPVS
jgi:Flp pilus assembly pilin Flp